MYFASTARAPEIRIVEKGLLKSHLWCADDLTRLDDRLH